MADYITPWAKGQVWSLFYDRLDKKFRIGVFNYEQHSRYGFKTREAAKNAIEEIGQDSLIFMWEQGLNV